MSDDAWTCMQRSLPPIKAALEPLAIGTPTTVTCKVEVHRYLARGEK